MARIVVTGGAGFIGANFVHMAVAAHPNDTFVVFDALTYAGNAKNLDPVTGTHNFAFVKGDINDAEAVEKLVSSGVDGIINFAAESHVDRSIAGAADFVRTNVGGTQVLLDAARKHGVKRFLQISTDEVYGSLGSDGLFTEESPLDPSSPYSASKAAADLLALAYHRTYGLDVVITRCSNNYGPYQFPEKLIPLFVTNALAGEPLPLYGDGMNVRDWIHVRDHAKAIDVAYRKGKSGEVYNIGGNNERTNREITGIILSKLEKPQSLVRFVADRLGHDRRYAIDSSKAERELGWKAEIGFETGMAETIGWYLDNRTWWEEIKSGAYLDYYDGMYGDRLKESRPASE